VRGGRATARLVLAGALALTSVVSCSEGDTGDAGDAAGRRSGAAEALPRLHAVRGDHPAIVDQDGRQVILRGVNLNSLAEYAQANPDFEPVRPLTDNEWDAMAAEGFDVVRLLVSWSRLEPERGRIDESYVDEIRRAVRDAAARDMYTVVDMHQDAWGPHVATPPGVDCPPGTEPSTGWDGAPAWATPAAGTNSCRTAGGEAKPGSPLVTEAWHRFYTDAGGVQTRFLAVWEHLAEALAGEPSVAGYDLLNEPGHGRGATAPEGIAAEFPPLGDLYERAAAAIRRGERAGGTEPRPIFFEYTVQGSPPPVGFSDDPGLVFAPHVYGGSIVEQITVDQNWDFAWALAEGYRTTLWVGEYGWFDDPARRPDYVDRARRFAAREDGADGPDGADGAEGAGGGAVAAGSAWWQWHTGCGDPHGIRDPGGTPEGTNWHYRRTTCPDGVDHGVVPEWHEIVGRPYPRAAPGRITALDVDPSTGTLSLRAEDAEPGSTVDLWFPGSSGANEPTVSGTGITRADARRVPGGYRITAETRRPRYELTIAPTR
jgi:endoglycosylceramidase